MRHTRVLKEVDDERVRQDDKWGEQSHPLDTWLTVLAEEVGELAQAILKGRTAEARNEAIQVAAVAVAIVEFIDRGREPLPRMTEDERAAKEAAALTRMAEAQGRLGPAGTGSKWDGPIVEP